MARLHRLILPLLLLGTSTLAVADNLSLPPGFPDREMFTMELPVRGMSMETVLDQFGQPSQAAEPIGEPPITRWVYRDYTVYFEDRFVIHSVLTVD